MRHRIWSLKTVIQTGVRAIKNETVRIIDVDGGKETISAELIDELGRSTIITMDHMTAVELGITLLECVLSSPTEDQHKRFKALAEKFLNHEEEK